MKPWKLGVYLINSSLSFTLRFVDQWFLGHQNQWDIGGVEKRCVRCHQRMYHLPPKYRLD